jgi:hypothetical protein
MSKFIALSTAALACSVALSGVLGLVTPTGPAANGLLPSSEQIVHILMLVMRAKPLQALC